MMVDFVVASATTNHAVILSQNRDFKMPKGILPALKPVHKCHPYAQCAE
jgi:hypothetical protein